MANCEYLLRIGNNQISFRSQLNERNDYSLQDLGESIIRGEFKGDLNKIVESLKNTIKKPQNINNVTIDANCVGITSLQDVIDSLDLESNELGLPITQVVNKLRDIDGINLLKLNVIPGDFTSSEFSLASRYDKDSSCILLNTNHILENVYADTLKALIDYYIFNIPKNKLQEFGENISADDVSEALSSINLTPQQNKFLNILSNQLGLDIELLKQLNKYQITTISLTRSAIDDAGKENLQQLYEMQSENINLYPATSSKIQVQGTVENFVQGNLDRGDIIILDVDGQRIKRNGELSTLDDFNKYQEKSTGSYTNGKEFVFQEYIKNAKVVKVLNPRTGKTETLSIDDPRLFWEEDEAVLYKENKRIWSNKFNYSGNKYIKLKKFNPRGLVTKIHNWEPSFKSVQDFKNKLEDRKQLMPVGFQTKEKFTNSISKFLDSGDYFILNGVTYYIKSKRDQFFEVEHIRDGKLEQEIIDFNIFTPSVVYFDPNKLFSIENINSTDKLVPSIVKGKDRVIAPENSPNISKYYASLADVGDILIWYDKDNDIERWNYIIGVNRNESRPSFKVLVQAKDGDKYSFHAQTVTGNYKGIIINKENTEPLTERLRNPQFIDKLNKITSLKEMLRFPGDRSSQQDSFSDQVLNYTQIIKAGRKYDSLSENSIRVLNSVNAGDIIQTDDGYFIVSSSEYGKITVLDQNGQYLVLNYGDVKGVITTNIDESADLTNTLNQYYVTDLDGINQYFNSKLTNIEETKTDNTLKRRIKIDSKTFAEEVILIIPEATLNKNKGKKRFIEKNHLIGAKWTSNLQVPKGYVNVTDNYIKFHNLKEGKALYRINRNGINLTKIPSSYTKISNLTIDFDTIHDKLMPSMYLNFKVNTKLNENGADIGLKWFRILEHIKGDGYILNYSVYNDKGNLESTTIFVDEDFVSNNLFSIKAISKNDFNSTNRLMQKPLNKCKLDITKGTPNEIVNVVMDSIISRLGIKVIQRTSKEIKRDYGLENVKGFVTLSKSGEPFVVINTDQNMGETKIHELLHLILGTYKIENFENYRELLNTIVELARNSNIEEIKNIYNEINDNDSLDPTIKQEEIFVSVITHNLFTKLSSYIQSYNSKNNIIDVQKLLSDAFKNFFDNNSTIFNNIEIIYKEQLSKIFGILLGQDQTFESINNYIYNMNAVKTAFNIESLKQELINKNKLIQDCK